MISLTECIGMPSTSDPMSVLFDSSCAGLTRASIGKKSAAFKAMDYRVKLGNDSGWVGDLCRMPAK
jgi:hypothetical protein